MIFRKLTPGVFTSPPPNDEGKVRDQLHVLNQQPQFLIWLYCTHTHLALLYVRTLLPTLYRKGAAQEDEKNFIKKLRIAVTGQNLFVWTKYSGLDPEVNVDKQISGVPSLGIDYTAYPRARTVSFSLGATF